MLGLLATIIVIGFLILIGVMALLPGLLATIIVTGFLILIGVMALLVVVGFILEVRGYGRHR